MAWKLWKVVNGCKIMRQPQPHQKGNYEYEVFAPDGQHFHGSHSYIAHDEKQAVEFATTDVRSECPADCSCKEE